VTPGAGTGPRLAAADDAPLVARILAAGFVDDPVLTWIFDEPGRVAKLDVFFRFLAREALVPLGATYLTDGGCACWTPPGSPEWPPERAERLAALAAEHFTPDDMARLAAVSDLMDAHHPRQPHWYLGLIAVEPERQGRGCGRHLLEASLTAVDAARLPAYLESTNPRNRSLYERHGFERVEELELANGPTLTAMWRPGI
jgi:ribosomal protein S18 acetylase RimI-like enzyme